MLNGKAMTMRMLLASIVLSVSIVLLGLCPSVSLAHHLDVNSIPSDTWKKEAGVRVGFGAAGSLDGGVANVPQVIRLADGTLRMYYNPSANIHSAISSDGLSWTTEPGVRLSPGGIDGNAVIGHPFVFPMLGGGYRMYYEGFALDGTVRTFSALSTDGLIWTKEPGVRIDRGPLGSIDSFSAADAVVIEADGGLRMYYAGSPDRRTVVKILSAFSTDGLNWEKEPGVRVDVGGPGDPDAVGTSHHYVIRLPDGRIRIYYSGGKQTGPVSELFASGGILSATSTDGLNFTKEPGVRISLGSSGELDAGGILQPSLLQLADGSFRIYYAAQEQTGIFAPRILSAIALPSQ